jgi:hypothetical protein
MNWLRDHAFLATWLALPVAIISIFVQNIPTKFKDLDWSRSLIYIAFTICLGVSFTPSFDENARSLARQLSIWGFIFLVIDRIPRNPKPPTPDKV